MVRDRGVAASAMHKEHVHHCPNCGAVVSASRFARVATCSFCGATVHLDEGVLSVARFREAHQAWRAADPALAGASIAAGGDAWTRLAHIARGEIADVFQVVRQRWPGERALLKLLRDPADAPLFEQEWRALTRLASSSAAGAEILARRVPQPIRFDPKAPGGRPVMVLGWEPGFRHTLADVRRMRPAGIEPRISIWMWRRLLEVLVVVHRSGLVHGAVLPQHILIARGEHRVRLVGFSCAAAPGDPLLAICIPYEHLYAAELRDTQRLAPAHDVAMSAKAIGFALGADERGRLPASVPARLAGLLDEVGAGGARDPWALREALGQLAIELFGPPSFCPLDIA
jgi:hypothetical protein